MSTNESHRERLRRLCVVLLFLVVSAIFLRMIWSMVLALVLAAILSGLTHPLYRRLLGLFGGRSSLAAGATVAVVIVLIVTPLVFFTGMLAEQAVAINESVAPRVNELLQELEEPGTSLETVPFWDRLEKYREPLTKKLGEAAAAASSFLAAGISAAAQRTMSFLFLLFIMLYSMLFFLVHGGDLLAQIMSLIPLDQSDKDDLLDKFVSVSRATLKGTLVIGIIQGGLAGLAFAVAGIEGALFWGTIMAILSIIPGIGATLVWAPAVVYLFAVGKTVAAIGLLVWCALVVGTADNLLRPLLVGKDTQMPDLLVMLSTFGGIALFGAVGVILGPVVAALFLSVWRIYRETFGELLAAPESSREAGSG